MGLRSAVARLPRPAVHRALRRLHERATRPGFLQGRALPALDLAMPHEVFDLALQDVVAGRGLEAARATSVQHLVMDGAQALAAAEAPHASPDAAHVHAGTFAASLAAAVRAAEALAEVQRGSFEVRLLRCAALHLRALWLRNDAFGEDVVVPVEPAPPGLVSGQPTTVDALLQAIRPLAAVRAGQRLHR